MLIGSTKYGKQFRCCVITFVFLLITGSLLVAQDSSQRNAVSPQKVFYGQASYYANKFNGRKTANGDIFSQQKMTCACNVVRLGTWLRVTNIKNGKSVIVKVNDRLHPRMKRLVDLSALAADKLGYTQNGLARVKVEVLGRKKPS